MIIRKFDRKTAAEYLSLEYPACPEEFKSELIHRIADRDWKDANLPKATGIVVSNYIRHHLTVYEPLLKRYRLTRREARLWVSDRVNEITAQWRKGAPVRIKKKKRRRSRKPKS